MSKPHTPTRQCPHRWCRTAHKTIVAYGLFLISGIAIRQPATLPPLIAMTVLAFAVVGILTKKSPHDLLTDDLRPVVPLAVRTNWANLAIAVDGVVILGSPLAVLAVLQAAPGQLTADGSSDSPVGIVIAISFTVFRELAHYMATRPVRPKRILAPAAN